MALTTNSYEVTGELSAPQDFIDGIHRTRLAHSETIQLTAKRIDVDELAARRGESDTQIEFEFIIGITDETESNPAVSGRMDAANGKWILIRADFDNNHVRFDIYE